MPSSLTPGSSIIASVQCRDADAAFAEIRAARHSQHSRNPFHAGPGFRGFTGSPLLRPVRLLAPLDGSDRVSPATGGFYIQASDGSVTLPVAGYDYNSLWTPLLAGLSPAGMTASLAAPDLASSRWPRAPPGHVIGGYLVRTPSPLNCRYQTIFITRHFASCTRRFRRLRHRQCHLPLILLGLLLSSPNLRLGLLLLPSPFG